MRHVEHEIRREAKRLVVAHERKHRLHTEEQKRIRARSTANPLLPALSDPPWWAVDIGFNPYKVRSRARHIAHSVHAALVERRYEPYRPVEQIVPKPDGGERRIAVYQVADSAVSKMIFESLLRKNLPLMSARSYAYRRDVTPQDAIRHVRTALHARPRMYVAEYDFSKYFDTISHEYLEEVLDRHFVVSSVERAVIRGFLAMATSPIQGYVPHGGPKRQEGIPQGTSISLFLANAAAWELDRALEDHGVGFVRYADDTLIWTTDYGRITAAADILHRHGEAMNVKVNLSKSEGIRLLLPEMARSEMRSTGHVDYLGYRVGLESVSLKPSAEKKIRARIQKLIYNTLLREPLAGTQELERLAPNVDKDYAMVIARMRRYLYGDLSEREMRRYARRDASLRRFKGVMAAFPLLNDDAHLKALDEWLLSCLWLAMRKRSALLTAQGVKSLPPPHGLPRSALRSLKVKSSNTGDTIDLRAPSVRRIARLVDGHSPREF
jgi:RNA-directed DNA polymerase